MALRLRITEIFYSLQGEANTAGWPTVFVRLTGCPLRCTYCDTAYAFTGGAWKSIDDILKEVALYPTPFVTITGGEPLAQKPVLTLMQKLCDAHYRVSLETSGAMNVGLVDARVSKVMDVKTPSSLEAHRHLDSNVAFINPHDQIKFVIGSREDYDFSKDWLKKNPLPEGCTVLFSPSAGVMPPEVLAEWILNDRLLVRFQVQLHKMLWGDKQGV